VRHYHPFRALRRRFGVKQSKTRKRPPSARLRLIQLEDRVTPSNLPFTLPRPVGPQVLNSTAEDASGDGVILYNVLNTNNMWCVYAQLTDPQGSLVGDPILVNTPSGGDAIAADVAMAPDGNFVAVYYGAGPNNADDGGCGIYARRFNADGTPVAGGEFLVAPNGIDANMLPTVAIDPDDNFVVAWADPNTNDSPAASLYSWDMSTVSGLFYLDQGNNTSPGDRGQGPQVSIATDGTLVASYMAGTGGSDVTACVQQFNYSSDGNGNFSMVAGSSSWIDTQSQLWAVAPVAAPDGSFVATMVTRTTDGSYIEQVSLQHFAADGTPLDANPVPVVGSLGANGYSWDAIAGSGFDSAGNLYLAWYMGADWGAGNMYLQRFAPDGTTFGSPLQITPRSVGGVTPNAELVSATSAAVAPDGSILAGWTSYTPTSGNYSVQARHYDPITDSQTETDTLTPASGSGTVSVVSTETTLGDSVLWEYRVTNNTTHSMGQFSISAQPDGVTDESNDLGWTANSSGVGWTTNSSGQYLAAGATGYFTVTTPSAYAATPTASQAGGGTFTSTFSGTVSAPVPTVTETTLLKMNAGTADEQDVRVTSTATLVTDGILWDYKVTNVSLVGEYPFSGSGMAEFNVYSLFGPESNPYSSLGWWHAMGTASDPAVAFRGLEWANQTTYLQPGQSADFQFTTFGAAIGQVTALAGAMYAIGSATGLVLGPVAPQPAILLKSIEYSGDTFRSIDRDNSGRAFEAPQWYDANGDGNADSPNLGDHNFPVAYYRGGTVKLKVEINLTGVTPPNAGAHLYFIGVGPDGIHTEVYDAGSPIGGAKVKWDAETTLLPDYVHAYAGGFSIAWRYQWANGAPNWGGAGWADFGTSANPLYVLYAKTAAGDAYYTVVHNAAVWADGARTWQDVVDEDWMAYDVSRNDGGLTWMQPKTPDGTIAGQNQKLFYYGYWGTTVNNIGGLLENGDGQCSAWAKLWQDEIKIQGVEADAHNSAKVDIIVPKKVRNATLGVDVPQGFLVNNWFIPETPGGPADSSFPTYGFRANFAARGPGDNDGTAPPRHVSTTVQSDNYYVFAGGTDIHYLGGHAQGQHVAIEPSGIENGNLNPVANFMNHVIVSFNGKIYDPSYGTVFSSLKDWEAGSVAGLYVDRTGSWAIRRVQPGDDDFVYV
jgi:hypothetical protein